MAVMVEQNQAVAASSRSQGSSNPPPRTPPVTSNCPPPPREGKGTRGRAQRRLGGRLGARAGCSNLVLLNINGCRKVSLEGGGEGAASGELEPDSFP